MDVRAAGLEQSVQVKPLVRCENEPFQHLKMTVIINIRPQKMVPSSFALIVLQFFLISHAEL